MIVILAVGANRQDDRLVARRTEARGHSLAPREIRDMSSRKFALVVLLLAAARLPGQTISGRVYDSVAKAPLAGAMVQLVSSTPGAVPPMQATTDRDGKYTLSNVAPGGYVLGFYHAVLDSIGIEPPFIRVEVGGARGTTPLRADLAVPSPARILTAICGPRPAKDSVGVLVGHVYDAATRQAVAGGHVVAEWRTFGVVNGKLQVSNPQVIATTTANGWFAICGVPRNDDVVLEAARGGDTTGAATVHVPASGLAQRALFVDKTEMVTVALKDSAGTPDTTRPPEPVHRGRSRLTGTVTDVNSKRPLTGAQVRIAGAALVGLTDDRGVFNISEAPGGTQTLLIRAVGYAPEQRTVELVADGSLSVDISLTNLRSLLDTIRITASRVYSRDGNGFERRRKIGSGHYFDSTDVEHYRPSEITGLLEMVGGVRVAGAGLNQRIIMQHIDACEPTIFVDGMAFADFTAADLNMMVPPEDVIGVEVYTSAATAPVQFKGMQSLSRAGRGCGSVVVWTKRSR
jgi:hypothetical protein